MSILYTRSDIEKMDRLPRLTLINSITGFKPANLIGSISSAGHPNLAIFSSVVHMGSAPALIGMFSRPTVVERDTYRNIKETGYYTINHVPQTYYTEAHQTSAKYATEVSEFEACGLSMWKSPGIPAPYVEESPLKIGLSLVEEMPIKANGTILIIGQVEEIHLPEAAVQKDGSLDFDILDTVCLSGLDTYYRPQLLQRLPYARVEANTTDQ